MFYVYLLRYPDGLPFYVGKGKGDRARRHFSRSHSAFVRRIVAKIVRMGGELTLESVFRSNEESAAFQEERRLIALYGRRNNGTGILANLTDGGEGQAGRLVSVMTRRLLALRGRQRITSASTKRKLSAVFAGRRLPIEQRQKLSEAARIRYLDRAERDKQAERTARQWTPERRAAAAELMRRRWASDVGFRRRVRVAASARTGQQWADPAERAYLLERRRAAKLIRRDGERRRI